MTKALLYSSCIVRIKIKKLAVTQCIVARILSFVPYLLCFLVGHNAPLLRLNI